MIKKALIKTVMISIAILVFIISLLLISPLDCIDFSYEFLFDHSPWISIWLTIFSIAISLFTASVANDISIFSFNKEFEIAIKCENIKSIEVKESEKFNYYKKICNNKKKSKILNRDLYKIQIPLDKSLNTSLKYEAFDLQLSKSSNEFIKKDILLIELTRSKKKDDNDEIVMYVNISKEDFFDHLINPNMYQLKEEKYLDLVVRFKVKSNDERYSQKVQLYLTLENTGSEYKIIQSFTFFDWKSHFKQFNGRSLY